MGGGGNVLASGGFLAALETSPFDVLCFAIVRSVMTGVAGAKRSNKQIKIKETRKELFLFLLFFMNYETLSLVEAVPIHCSTR